MSRWRDLGRAVFVGILAGTASAFLLWALDVATAVQQAHRWTVWLLPLVGWLTMQWPQVLVGTILTHLCGGSAGREGTANQMGAAIAVKLGGEDWKRVGLSAGFASVFGTPWSGFLFGLERTDAPRFDWRCWVAAMVGNDVALGWGAHHTVYRIGVFPGVEGMWILLLPAVAFGLAAWGYHLLTALVRFRFNAVGVGLAVAIVLYSTQAWQYAGLGVPGIQAAFAGPVAPYDWAAKLVLTAITVGSGFQGGEATPLFFVGATLGNWMGGPFLAGLGFAAVFAAATRTPVASSMMAAELFGLPVIPFALAACFIADFANRKAQSSWARYSSPPSAPSETAGRG